MRHVTRIRTTLSSRAAALLTGLWLVTASSFASGSDSIAPAGDDQGVLRFDPFNRQMVPVSPHEMKVGCIYSHYNPRLNRRVWSFLQPDGKLWRAFGPGTTQRATRLDLRASEREALERVREEAPELAAELYRTGEPIYIRLGDDGRWTLAPYGVRESIYDLESGRRWEWYRDRYLPVRHTLGYHWARKNGHYVPKPRYHPAMLFGARYSQKPKRIWATSNWSTGGPAAPKKPLAHPR